MKPKGWFWARRRHPFKALAALFLVAPPTDGSARLQRARQLLEQAIERERDVPRGGFEGQKVDKYFGTKLPPVCAKLGCYVTDDGKRFYCVNPSCRKHTKRLTKHNRRGLGKRTESVFFHCPVCRSRDIDLRPFTQDYKCSGCEHVWKP